MTVIAAGKGIDGIFSIQKERLQMDENMVCQALNQLYQQEFISNSEQGGFVLNDDLEKMMTEISQAGTVVLIRDFTQTEVLKIIYIGNRLIAIEQSKADAGSIRLYEIPQKELKNFLEGDIQGKERQYKQVLDEEELFYKALESPSVLKSYEMNSLGNAIIMIEQMNLKKNIVNSRILIRQEKKGKQLLRYQQEEKLLCVSQEDTFVDIVVEMIREVLYDIG